MYYSVPLDQAVADGDQSPKQSWSPVTYNGSASTEDEFGENCTKFSSNDDVFDTVANEQGNEATKSCEVKLAVNFNTDSKNSASSAPPHPVRNVALKHGLARRSGRKGSPSPHRLPCPNYLQSKTFRRPAQPQRFPQLPRC